MNNIINMIDMIIDIQHHQSFKIIKVNKINSTNQHPIQKRTKVAGKHKTEKRGEKVLQSPSPTQPIRTFSYITILVYVSVVVFVRFLGPIWCLLGLGWLGLGPVFCDVHYVVPGFPRLLGWLAGMDSPILTGMSDLSPLDEVERRRVLAEQVRQHNSAKIYELVAQLEPLALGFSGPVNPGVVRVYLEALKELGRLWRVFDKPVEVVESVVDERPELEASRARVEVLRMLESMARKSGSDEPSTS